MTALAKSNEPTMEEILASIRKIIADDHAAAAKPAAVTAPPAANPPPPAAAAPEPDIIDLAIEATPVEEDAPKSQDDIDLLFADPEPPPAAQAPKAPEPQPIAPQPVAPVPNPVAAPAPQPAAAEPAAAAPLLSQATSASVAGAFASLSNTLLSQNARTLDDLVQDMLRPMLKTWLDDNLPGIVERLVRAEIERVSRGVR